MFTAPPAWASSFRSDDLDEVRAYIALYDGDHRRNTVGRGALGYVAHATRCGDIDLGWIRRGQRQRLAASPRAPTLHVPLFARHVYQSGSRTLEAHPAMALLLPPGRAYRAHTDPDCTIAIRIPPAALAAELAARRGDAAKPMSWDALAIPLAGKSACALFDLHRALVQASGCAADGGDDASLSRNRRLAELGAHFVSWVADQLLGTRPGAATAAIGIRRLRQVEEWIDENLTSPITLARLCAAAGVGERWLESSFKARYGQTPLHYVTARRLALVRRRLAEARPGQTVTQIAEDAGFMHLGRFAGSYRQTYGETPSETLVVDS